MNGWCFIFLRLQGLIRAKHKQIIFISLEVLKFDSISNA